MKKQRMSMRAASHVSGTRVSVRNVTHSPLIASNPLLEDVSEVVESWRNMQPDVDSESEASMDDDYIVSGIKADKSKKEDAYLSESNTFKMIAGAIIMANTVVIALETIYIQEQLAMFNFLELAFTAFYSVEIVWRMWERGVFIFLSTGEWWWSWFDLVITALSVVDAVLSQYSGSSSGASVGRLFRVFRILRMFRAMKFLKEVDYVIGQAALATFKLATIVTLVLFVSSIIATNMLWDSSDPIVADMFRDLPSSMWALFKLMTLDDWQSTCNRVIKVKPGMRVFFVVFIFTTSIALISLVPAIFIELSLNARKREDELKEEKQKVVLRREKKRLLHFLFQLTDQDQNGMISVAEMKTILTNDTYLRKLQESGLTGPGELRDVRLGLFDLWEESFEESARTDFEISEEEFINGLLRVRENVSQAVLWRCITATRLMLRDLSAHVRKEMQRMDTRSGNLEREIRGLIKAATADILTSQEHIRHTLHATEHSVQHANSRSSFEAATPLYPAGGASSPFTSQLSEEKPMLKTLSTRSTYNEDLDVEFAEITSLMRHLEKQENELFTNSNSVAQFAEQAAAPVAPAAPAAPSAPPRVRESSNDTTEWDRFRSEYGLLEASQNSQEAVASMSSLKNRRVSGASSNYQSLGRKSRSVEFQVVPEEEPDSDLRSQSKERLPDGFATNGLSDDELPLITQDVPSSDMFVSEGLAVDAAYLL